MEQKWKQIIGAFILGALMPGMVLRMGGIPTGISPQIAEPSAPGETVSISASAPTQTEPQTAPVPVWMPDGTVQAMELESYLVGVVLGEMPADFAEEALKAQAVVARTFTLYCMENGFRHSGGGVCTDPGCCQSYVSPDTYLAQGGTQENLDKIRAAVEQTQGRVLTYQGELIEAAYFSCSGGRTEDAAAVWGGDVPYLQSVESPGEEWAAVYHKTVSFSSEEFAALLGRNLSGTPESWLGTVTYTKGGGVATMVIGGKSYTGTQLRALLGLYSTAFTMEISGGEILVTTTGKGHRVGMSQYGADVMALQGATYEQILLHYYTEVRVDSTGNL